DEAGAPDASALRAREANYQEKPFFATEPGAETGRGEGPLCHLTHTFGTQVPDWHAARAGGGGVGWTRFKFDGASLSQVVARLGRGEERELNQCQGRAGADQQPGTRFHAGPTSQSRVGATPRSSAGPCWGLGVGGV